MAAHALLSASGAYRWTECTPSARFEQQFQDSESLYALEGTIAHAVGEWALLNDAPCEDVTPFDVPELEKLELIFGEDWVQEIQPMARHVQAYVDYVMALPGDRFIEQRVDFSHIVPEGFGTSDAIVLHEKTVDIVDLKYGKGIKVFADGPQAKLYAIGAMKDYGFIFDGVERVRLHIVQPRLDHVDVHEMAIEELNEYSLWLKQRAEIAWKGEGDFKPGDHCGFCRGKARCKARAEYNIKFAMEDFAVPTPDPTTNTLTHDEIALILGQADQIAKWVEAVKAYALEQALTGEEFPGFKVVEGRSTRKWIDENKVVEAMQAQGLTNEQIYNLKLIGITEAEKLLGKKSPVLELTEKADGKPALVPETDKRPPIKSASAARDFA